MNTEDCQCQSPTARARRNQRIDLGLALLHHYAIPGVPLDKSDIAAWCGVSQQGIWHIEQRALKKLRNKLRCKFPELTQALHEMLYTK